MSRTLTFLLFVLSLGLAMPAAAQDEFDDLDDLDDLEDEEGAEDDDEGVDTQEIYEDYKSEMRGEAPAEELDAWRRYLDVYPNSMYRMEIEKRMKGLEEASFRELESDDLDDLDSNDDTVDAKDQEMFLMEPALLNMSPNTRRHFKVHALWGFSDMLNYEAAFEWAFMRKFSAYGRIRHLGRGFGGQLVAGAKYALVKDVRTGVILSGAIAIAVGYNGNDRLNLGIEPTIGFAWIASEKFQVQTSIIPYVRLDRPRLLLYWDVMAVVRPAKPIGIYFESKQKHSFYKPENADAKYLGFHHAGVGAKIFPTQAFELSVGVNVPYAWDRWKDYRYFGINAGVTVYLDKKKQG